MNIQQTLSIIKPDATKRNIVGKILSKLEGSGLKIIAQKKIHLTENQAQEFYKVHEERPFYNDLVKFMISGPVIVQVLEGDDAVAKNRDVMGATNPEDAKDGTIRKEFAESLEANSVHGSDSIENANTEISFFFSKIEIVN
tara:strand:+ start:301 stop:723 length:423 start_codon:yes stop_codon:yes gene_type:complete